MISREEIHKILKKYDPSKIKIATLCSHSALQIFHGAKAEGFKTVGICLASKKQAYDAFPLGKPDEYIVLDGYKDILGSTIQKKLIRGNTIVIPHGSFVEYVGPENLENDFFVPMFGNRTTLEWERDRDKQRQWLIGSGLKMPDKYTPEEINKKVFVKFNGARGGKGFFVVNSKKEFDEKLKKSITDGTISEKDAADVIVQEFITGVRYYPHYFYSVFEHEGMRAGAGRVELLGIDKRIEIIDESYRGLPVVSDDFFDYTVTGNQPVVIRESLLSELIGFGAKVVDNSVKLFAPGIIGPFCLEMLFHPKTGFTTFEISARIVAGTNLYPNGSPYSAYLFGEPMSTGRRMAREIKEGIKRKELEKIIF